jgi:hypothetical protein
MTNESISGQAVKQGRNRDLREHYRVMRDKGLKQETRQDADRRRSVLSGSSSTAMPAPTGAFAASDPLSGVLECADIPRSESALFSDAPLWSNVSVAWSHVI